MRLLIAEVHLKFPIFLNSLFWTRVLLRQNQSWTRKLLIKLSFSDTFFHVKLRFMTSTRYTTQKFLVSIDVQFHGTNIFFVLLFK